MELVVLNWLDGGAGGVFTTVYGSRVGRLLGWTAGIVLLVGQ